MFFWCLMSACHFTVTFYSRGMEIFRQRDSSFNCPYTILFLCVFSSSFFCCRNVYVGEEWRMTWDIQKYFKVILVPLLLSAHQCLLNARFINWYFVLIFCYSFYHVVFCKGIFFQSLFVKMSVPSNKQLKALQ